MAKAAQQPAFDDTNRGLDFRLVTRASRPRRQDGATTSFRNQGADCLGICTQALDEYRKRAEAALSAEQSDNDRMEQEIADYEAKLADANRFRITPGLREWLQSK